MVHSTKGTPGLQWSGSSRGVPVQNWEMQHVLQMDNWCTAWHVGNLALVGRKYALSCYTFCYRSECFWVEKQYRNLCKLTGFWGNVRIFTLQTLIKAKMLLFPSFSHPFHPVTSWILGIFLNAGCNYQMLDWFWVSAYLAKPLVSFLNFALF